jgi:hypothetical protein
MLCISWGEWGGGGVRKLVREEKVISQQTKVRRIRREIKLRGRKVGQTKWKMKISEIRRMRHEKKVK